MRGGGLALGVALVAVATTTASEQAGACLNGYYRTLEQQVAAVAQTEVHVATGKPRLAAQSLLNLYPKLRSTLIGRAPVTDRALRVMARAVVRTKGAIDAGSRFPGETAAQQEANVTWAVAVLHDFSSQEPKSAAAKTDYAEALAQNPKSRGAALRILEALAEKDLVASPYGYAALASLRAFDGDGKPSFIAAPGQALAHARIELAKARCRRMAADDAICGDADDTPKM